MNDVFAVKYSSQLYDKLISYNPFIKKINLPDWPNSNALYSIARESCTEFFYVITSANIDINGDYRFNFVPGPDQAQIMHTWGHDNHVRLYSRKEVLSSPELYCDEKWKSGEQNMIRMPDVLYTEQKFDVVFLSYKEKNIREKFEKFKTMCPRAIHISSVTGILEAHKAAAKSVSTNMFYVVDADADVRQTFTFDYFPLAGQEEFIHVWRSYNPSVDLEYGYGGVKLFPTQLVRDASTWNLDFTTSLNTGFVAMDTVSNNTNINDTAFDAWKSAFRECTKLASNMLPNDSNSRQRLEKWLNPNLDLKFGFHVKKGAEDGVAFANINKNNLSELKLINNYAWLREIYNSDSDFSAYIKYFLEFKSINE